MVASEMINNSTLIRVRIRSWIKRRHMEGVDPYDVYLFTIMKYLIIFIGSRIMLRMNYWGLFILYENFQP